MLIKRLQKSGGFSLIELIVVISILGVLTAISAPYFPEVLGNSRVAKDKSNLWVLNRVTMLYGHNKTITNNDIFDGFTTDDERMNELVSEKYINEAIIPAKSGTQFNWSIPDQKWLYSLYQVAEDSSNSIQNLFFKLLDIGDFTTTGNWTKTDNGFYSSYGLLFIDNKKDEYTITTKAKLDEGNVGGYGILFETSVAQDTKDTGFVLQFDSGYGGIIIRRRENGVEKNPVLVVKNSDNPIIPSSKSDDWWTQEHEVKIQVNSDSGTEGQKSLSFWIGDEKIIDNWGFESNVEPENNFSGFRSWHEGTTYEEMTIQ